MLGEWYHICICGGIYLLVQSTQANCLLTLFILYTDRHILVVCLLSICVQINNVKR
jgi:hypothetical protein